MARQPRVVYDVPFDFFQLTYVGRLIHKRIETLGAALAAPSNGRAKRNETQRRAELEALTEVAYLLQDAHKEHLRGLKL